MICWKNNEWQLSGIFSWGLTICGADGLPGVYSKVSHFRYWIDEQVAKVSILGLKFIYSEKATKFCEIFYLTFDYIQISQNFVAFSEYINFNLQF